MRKNDWFGITLSLVLHLLLAIGLGMVTTATAPPEFGFIEVDLGSFSEGRPVRRVENVPKPEPEPPRPEPQEEVPPKPTPAPEKAKPVELPEQSDPVQDEEVVETPDTDIVAPEKQEDKVEEVKPPEETPQEEIKPLGGETADGTSGTQEGDPGTGTAEEKTSPYSLEGLNRTPLRAPLPAYSEQVNAVIKVRITVDPSGRVTAVVPLRKGNPELERSVMEALRRWQFNTLAANAPQVVQYGIVTFSFRLE